MILLGRPTGGAPWLALALAALALALALDWTPAPVTLGDCLDARWPLLDTTCVDLVTDH